MNIKTLKVLEFDKIRKALSEHCNSEMGKELAINIEPSTDENEVMNMLEETQEAESLILKTPNIPNLSIKNIKSILDRAKINSIIDIKYFLEINNNIKISKGFKSFFNKIDNTEFKILDAMVSEIQNTNDLEREIDRIIISEEEIADDASADLKTIRRSIDSSNQKIRDILNKLVNSQSKSKYIQEKIITMRDGRYVIPVKQEYRGLIKGLVHDRSSSGATVFIEPISVVDENNKLKDLSLKEENEIRKILQELTSQVAIYYNELIANQEIIKKIDFIIAKGKYALKLNAVKPLISYKNDVFFKNARHPLIDKDEVVPSNIWLGDKFNTLIITGPNTGGKTVTLKTLGLLSIMGQSGLNIPADSGSKINIYDNIFADIGDEQSIEQSLSTFSSHMTNIVNIVDGFTDNSLILFDELGAGTDPTEGAALAMGILDYLKSFNVHVLATTHYSELKQYALTNDNIENASVDFNVQTLKPTYKLSIGIPGKSNAFEISKRLGLDDGVINNAKKFLTSENIKFEDILKNIEENKVKSQEENTKVKQLRLELEENKRIYEDKIKKLEESKNKLVSKAKSDAKAIVEKAKKESEEIILELRKLKEEEDISKINKEIEEKRKKLSEKNKELAPKLSYKVSKKTTQENFKSGDNVLILNLDKEGYIEEVYPNKKEALVQAGIMKVNIHFSQLKKIEKKQDEKITKIIKSRSKQISSELDLRGMTLEEAIIDVDKYLDDAFLSNLNQVTIIHGIGSGVLKMGIKQILKRHKHVKSFREGKYGEGGQGVTVVEIK